MYKEIKIIKTNKTLQGFYCIAAAYPLIIAGHE
jgi:hypothetical protein